MTYIVLEHPTPESVPSRSSSSPPLAAVLEPWPPDPPQPALDHLGGSFPLEVGTPVKRHLLVALGVGPVAERGLRRGRTCRRVRSGELSQGR